MSDSYNLTIKPDFLKDVLALPQKEMGQIMGKLTILARDPLPQGSVKKQLKYVSGGRKLHRLRSGDYRIFYTFDQHIISILALRRRDDDTYDEDLDAEFLGGLETGPESADPTTRHQQAPDWETIFKPRLRPLPEPITTDLLTRLEIPPRYHARLLQVKDQDALLSCPGVEDEILLKLDQYLFELPLREVESQPDLVLNEVGDLLRYKDGDLLGFLLKLSPEQEKYVEWPLEANGPGLVKGGPGTGKSTVALYRVRSLLEKLQAEGQAAPRILFTTYTNALVNSSRQLLEQLLGPQAAHVQVRTADSIVHTVLDTLHASRDREIIQPDELRPLLRQALKDLRYEGNPLQQQAQRQALQKMGLDYLQEEINTVIVARQLQTVEDYLAAARPGRKLRLNSSQRRAVWQVHERLGALLETNRKETWQQRRARAAILVEQSPEYHAYDAVVIDEAQDLDPTVLRLLVGLSKQPQRIFVTADANQSIYGSGFNWSDVHNSLRFQGRTNILRANYRSTREIGEAAQSYLGNGELEQPVGERLYINDGPLPDVRAIYNREHEVQLLVSFFRQAAQSLRLTIGSCAILCPGEGVGKELAFGLSERGLEATFMKGSDLNLTRPGVKILTLQSAKGLEFPIVALAGFIGSNYPVLPFDVSPEQREELLAKERRILFVGMTRAMRALLVVTPVNPDTELMRGFDPTHWNLNRTI